MSESLPPRVQDNPLEGCPGCLLDLRDSETPSYLCLGGLPALPQMPGLDSTSDCPKNKEIVRIKIFRRRGFSVVPVSSQIRGEASSLNICCVVSYTLPFSLSGSGVTQLPRKERALTGFTATLLCPIKFCRILDEPQILWFRILSLTFTQDTRPWEMQVQKAFISKLIWGSSRHTHCHSGSSLGAKGHNAQRSRVFILLAALGNFTDILVYIVSQVLDNHLMLLWSRQ